VWGGVMRWPAAVMLLSGLPNLSSSDGSLGCWLTMWVGNDDDTPGVLAISAAMLQANHNKLADTIIASNQGLDDSKFSLRLSLTHVAQRSVTVRLRHAIVRTNRGSLCMQSWSSWPSSLA
jgi:hypothetical protein